MTEEQCVFAQREGVILPRRHTCYADGEEGQSGDRQPVDNACRLRGVGLEPLIGEAIDTAAIVGQWSGLMQLKVSIEAGVAGEIIELFGRPESNKRSCASHEPARAATRKALRGEQPFVEEGSPLSA
jgi:hypothetical protein